MLLILAVTVFALGLVRPVSSTCPKLVEWFNNSKACALIYADANCTGYPFVLLPDGGTPNLRRHFKYNGTADDKKEVAAVVRPLCSLTYRNRNAERRWSTTHEGNDGEPWLQPWPEVKWTDCECTYAWDMLGNEAHGHCVPMENQTTVQQCDNFNGSTATECKYTTRFWPSYRGYPTDLEYDADRISVGEEGAFRSILSHKFPGRPLAWPSRDESTNSMNVPPYQLLRIKQRYFKCGYYVWPTSDVVTEFIKAPRQVYSMEPELRTCQPQIWVETTLSCTHNSTSNACVYSAILEPYKLRDPDVPSDEGLSLSKREEEDLERIMSRELATDFPKTPLLKDFTYVTRLPPAQRPRVVRRTFRCGSFMWPTIQVLT